MRKIIRVRSVKEFTGYKANSTVYLRVSKGLLPKPVKIGARAAGWVEDEIAEINEARIAGKSDDEIRALVAKLETARRPSAA